MAADRFKNLELALLFRNTPPTKQSKNCPGRLVWGRNRNQTTSKMKATAIIRDAEFSAGLAF
jgi:hypothetical protein